MQRMGDIIRDRMGMVPDIDVVSVEGDVVFEEVRGRRRTQLETESS